LIQAVSCQYEGTGRDENSDMAIHLLNMVANAFQGKEHRYFFSLYCLKLFLLITT